MSGRPAPAVHADLARREVVLLDAGGTLITLDYDEVRRALPSTGPDDAALDAAEGRARVWGADAAARGVTGRELWDGYFGRILAEAAVPSAGHAAALDALWRTHHARGLWRRPIVGALEAVARLHAAGRRLAVVSNAEGQVEQDLAAAGFGAYLETVVDSHRVGVAKPDPRIFAIALERLGARAEQALYVGDVPAYDVAGARAAGMPAVLLDPWDIHAGVGDAVRIRSLAELPALLGI
ncbi:MAG: HAD family hydrolase [Acidobacteria bacterium]|nr:HAD family hydrolase [Acidobacteriota bacterium]